MGIADFFVALPTLLTNGVMVAGCLIYLVILSPRIFLVTLPFVALGAFGYHLANLKAIKYLRAGTAEQEQLFDHFRSLTGGAKELRLNRPKRRMFSDSVVAAIHRDRTPTTHHGHVRFCCGLQLGQFPDLRISRSRALRHRRGLPDRARVLTGFALVMVYLVGPLQALLLSLPDNSPRQGRG